MTELEAAERQVTDFAALSGTFSPVAALQDSRVSELARTAVAQIASSLSSICDTGGELGAGWLMRRSERQWALKSMMSEGRLESALAWRRTLPSFDTEAGDILDALEGRGRFSPTELDAKLNALESLPSLLDEDASVLTTVSTTLERVGDIVSGFEFLPRMYGLLNREVDHRRRNGILSDRFIGRNRDIAAIADWISAPGLSRGIVQCLLLQGIAGIGKSALLEKACERAYSKGTTPVIVRLDFDRPVLDVLDPLGLTLEIARQVSIQKPQSAKHLKAQRMLAAGGRRLKGGRESSDLMLERNLWEDLEHTLSEDKEPILLILDTLEALRERGPSHPKQLFDWLDDFHFSMSSEMKVIGAGRGLPLLDIPDRVAQTIDLKGLEDQQANSLLAQLGVPAPLWDTARRQTSNNPMLLQLTGRAEQINPGTIGRLSDAGAGDQAFLNRVLFARFQNPQLRKLAVHGLFLRRIGIDSIAELWPSFFKREAMGIAEAEAIFAQLQEMNWLMELEPRGKQLRMRADLRRELLPRYYRIHKTRAANVDRIAAAWFNSRDSFEDRVDGLYHALQAMRTGGQAPAIDKDAAYNLYDDDIDSLPIVARDLLRRARGERSESGRFAVGGDLHEQRTLEDLTFMMDRGDWEEARVIYEKIPHRDQIDPTSELADAICAYQWKTGKWADAIRSLNRRDRMVGRDGDWHNLRPFALLVRLEMRAELSFRRFTQRLNSDATFRLQVTEATYHSSKDKYPFGSLGLALSYSNANVRIGRLTEVVEAWGESKQGVPSNSGVQRLRAVMPDLEAYLAPAALTARSGAAMTPYADLLEERQRKRGSDRQGKLSLLLNGLTRLQLPVNGGLAAIRTGYVESRPQITLLRDTGLLAEALGVLALNGDPQIQVLARRAEHWRRIAAGRRPVNPRNGNFNLTGWSQGLDASLWFRIEELLKRPGTVENCWACLGAWLAADHMERPPEEILRSRLLRGKIKAVSAKYSDDPNHVNVFAIARRLLVHGVPTALVPPIAILLSHGEAL